MTCIFKRRDYKHTLILLHLFVQSVINIVMKLVPNSILQGETYKTVLVVDNLIHLPFFEFMCFVVNKILYLKTW